MAVAGARGRCRRPASSFFNGPNNLWHPSTAHTKWRRICAQHKAKGFAGLVSNPQRPRGGNRTLRRSEICSRGARIQSRWYARIGLQLDCARRMRAASWTARRSVAKYFDPVAVPFLTMVLSYPRGQNGVCAPVSARYQPEKPSSAPPIHREAPDSRTKPPPRGEPPPSPTPHQRRLQKPR